LSASRERPGAECAFPCGAAVARSIIFVFRPGKPSSNSPLCLQPCESIGAWLPFENAAVVICACICKINAHAILGCSPYLSAPGLLASRHRKGRARGRIHFPARASCAFGSCMEGDQLFEARHAAASLRPLSPPHSQTEGVTLRYDAHSPRKTAVSITSDPKACNIRRHSETPLLNTPPMRISSSQSKETPNCSVTSDPLPS
jgi:hypothetical protein